MFEWVPYNFRHPSKRFDHGSYDASHFDENVIQGKVTKEDLKLVFGKLSESEYWFPKIVPTTDGTYLFYLFVALFLIAVHMFMLGVHYSALLFKDILYFPFLFVPVYFAFHVLIKAKRRKFGQQYLEDRESEFMSILMKLN